MVPSSSCVEGKGGERSLPEIVVGCHGIHQERQPEDPRQPRPAPLRPGGDTEDLQAEGKRGRESGVLCSAVRRDAFMVAPRGREEGRQSAHRDRSKHNKEGSFVEERYRGRVLLGDEPRHPPEVQCREQRRADEREVVPAAPGLLGRYTVAPQHPDAPCLGEDRQEPHDQQGPCGPGLKPAGAGGPVANGAPIARRSAPRVASYITQSPHTITSPNGRKNEAKNNPYLASTGSQRKAQRCNSYCSTPTASLLVPPICHVQRRSGS